MPKRRPVNLLNDFWGVHNIFARGVAKLNKCTVPQELRYGSKLRKHLIYRRRIDSRDRHNHRVYVYIYLKEVNNT